MYVDWRAPSIRMAIGALSLVDYSLSKYTVIVTGHWSLILSQYKLLTLNTE